MGSPRFLPKNLNNHSNSSNSLSFVLSKFSPFASFRKRRFSKEEEPRRDFFESENPFFLDGVQTVSHGNLDDEENDNVSTMLGVSLSHLQALKLDPDYTVTQAIEHLVADFTESFVSRIADKKDCGPADAVVIFAPDMAWTHFLSVLARINPNRFLWITGLSSSPGSEPDYATVIPTIGHVELVLPSWADPDMLWSPLNCVASRVSGAEFTVLASVQDERQVVYAVNRGLPLGYFDALLAPKSHVGPEALNAVKRWVSQVLEKTPNGTLDPAVLAVALGHVHCSFNEFDLAISMYKETNDDLMHLGEAFRRSGRLLEAREVFEKLSEQAHEPVLVAVYSLHLGDILLELKEYAKALVVFEKALGIRRPHFGDQSEPVAQCLDRIASVLEAQGDIAGAVERLREVLSIRRNLPNRTKTADTLSKLGNLAMQQRDYNMALRKFMESLGLCKKALGQYHPTTLKCMQDTALAQIALGNASEAIDLLRKVVDMRLMLFGSDHDKTFLSIGHLSHAHALRGNFHEACRLLEDMLRAQERLFGVDNEVTVKTMKKIVCLKVMSRGQWE